ESRIEYARVITEWEAGGRRLSLENGDGDSDITINELMVAFWPIAEKHYRHLDGSTTGELDNIRVALRPLKTLYGHTLAKDFGPLSLKAVRDHMIRQPVVVKIKTTVPDTGKRVWKEKILRIGLARGVINQRIGRIRKLFKWAVENEMVPPAV